MKICKLAFLSAPSDILAGEHSHPILALSPGLPFHAGPSCVPKTAPHPSDCSPIPTHQMSPTREGDFEGLPSVTLKREKGFLSIVPVFPCSVFFAFT